MKMDDFCYSLKRDGWYRRSTLGVTVCQAERITSEANAGMSKLATTVHFISDARIYTKVSIQRFATGKD